MKEIPLNTTNSKSPYYKKHKVLIDDEDFERVNKYKWTVDKRGDILYARSQISEKMVYMHNFIMEDIGIDHADSDGLNNQRYNLRKANQQLNMANARKQEGRSSRYKGVCWTKQNSKWMAYIKKGKARFYLGYFDDEDEAGIAYNEKATELYGDYAKLNIILNYGKETGN